MQILTTIFFLLIFSLHSFAQSPTIPDPLTPWVTWVKEKHPEWECAKNNGEYDCIWPGSLQYTLAEKGAEFTARVEMLRNGSVPVPALPGLVPQNLEVKNTSGSAVSSSLAWEEGSLLLTLPKGSYQITGRFTWSEFPNELPAPSDFALVEIKGENKRMERDDEKVRIIDPEKEVLANGLTVTVFRSIVDGSPLTIESRFQFQVSGNSRSIQVGKVIPDESTPIAITSPLPYQLNSDGVLSLQLTPGEHTVTITSALSQPVSKIILPKSGLNEWPEEEIILWQADSRLRSVEISGVTPLSSELSQIPPEWNKGAAYVSHPGDTITLKVLSVGEQNKKPDNLGLLRVLWLDLDGKGFTASDFLSGSFYSAQRINSNPHMNIGRATGSGGTPLLISQDTKTEKSGIELQSAQISIQTVSRLPDSGKVAASGWDTTIQRDISYQVWLPPSWRLFSVSGADAPTSWFESWSLLDVFLSILIILGTHKLFGKSASLLTALCLLLNHGEFLAPCMLFIHLMLLFVWNSLLEHKESFWYRVSKGLIILTYAAWALQSLAFIKLQIVQLLYPQLESGMRHSTVLQTLISGLEINLIAWPYFLAIIAFIFIALRSIINSSGIWNKLLRIVGWGIAGFLMLAFSGGVVLMGGMAPPYPTAKYDSNVYHQQVSPMAPRSRSYDLAASKAGAAEESDGLLRQEGKFSYENKVLLSGPALPEWHWKQHSLTVLGPVSSDKELSICLLSPGVMRFISLIRVLSLLALIIVLFKRLGFSLPRVPGTALGVLAASMILLPYSANADFPPHELLQDLEQRLGSKQCMSESCATIAEAKLSLTKESFTLTLKVSSDGRSFITLPGPLDVLSPQSVKNNGNVSYALKRSEENFIQVRTEPGNNLIEVQGQVLNTGPWSLQFQDSPVITDVSTSDWYVEGLPESGEISDSIRLSPVSQSKDAVIQSKAELPTWVVSKREIAIGDKINLSSSIVRLGNSDKTAVTYLNLFPNEQVTTGNIQVNNGNAKITFAPGETSVSFSSTLPWSESLNLSAQKTARVSETWSVECSPLVHCDHAGLTSLTTDDDLSTSTSWNPFPGESVNISIKTLNGIPGELLTVDSVRHTLYPASTIREGNLSIKARATQQQTLSVTLPGSTTVKGSNLDSGTGGVFVNGNTLQFLLNPGSHEAQIRYSEPWSPKLRERIPQIKLSAPAHNIFTDVQPGNTRWLLWTGGGQWGPAVVFWSKLLCMVALCLGFYWMKVLDVGMLGAVLLGVGLTTLPLIVVSLPILWLAWIRLAPQLREKTQFIPHWLYLTCFGLVTVLSILLFWRIVEIGLVLEPPMLIAGNKSTAQELHWYSDHTSGELPIPWIVSLPMWYWRAFALAWATWLAVSMLRWLKGAVKVVQ